MHSLFEGPAQQPVSRRSSGRRLRMPSFSRFSPRGSDGRLRKSVLFTGAGLLGWSGAAAAFDIPVTPLNTVGILAQGAGYGIEAGGAAVHKAGDFLIWLNDHTFGDGDNEGAATSTTSTSTTTVQTLPPTTLPPGANAGPTVPPFSPTGSTLPPIEITTPGTLAPVVSTAPENSGIVQNSQGAFVAGAVSCSDQLQLVTIASGEYPFNAASRVTGFPFDRLETEKTDTGDTVWASILDLSVNTAAKAAGDLSVGDSFYAPLGCTVPPEYLLPE